MNASCYFCLHFKFIVGQLRWDLVHLFLWLYCFWVKTSNADKGCFTHEWLWLIQVYWQAHLQFEPNHGLNLFDMVLLPKPMMFLGFKRYNITLVAIVRLRISYLWYIELRGCHIHHNGLDGTKKKEPAFTESYLLGKNYLVFILLCSTLSINNRPLSCFSGLCFKSRDYGGSNS